MNRAPPAPRPRPASPPAPVATTPTPAAPPLLPILLPIVVAAIVSALLFSWLLPPVRPPGVAPVARFTDVTTASGITFARAAGATPDEVPTTLGGGVVVFDYDGDGRPDLFFVNGTAWPWEALGAWTHATACALYRNDGAGHFTDVSRAAGLDLVLQGMSAASADYDNDGHPDLFVTAIGGDRLFHNRGDGTFEDVTERAGVGGDEAQWSTGATWIDYDGDGRLDLVVCHYARWPREVPLELAFSVADLGRSYGTPSGFMAAFPSLYRNLGDGRFAPVADAAGLHALDPQTGFPVAKPLAVVPVDANGDGALDLLFTYQSADSLLFLNQRNGTFRRWQSGRDDRHEGVAATLLGAAALGTTADERFSALKAALALRGGTPGLLHLPPRLGVALFDYDHDGHLELFSGGGQAEADVNHFDRGHEFAAPPRLYWNNGGAWTPALPAGGAEATWTRPLVARGVAAADFDGDGSIDVVVTRASGPPLLLRNDQRRGLPWLQVDLVAKRGVRDAYGARVELYTPRGVLAQTKVPAMGFMAQSSSTLTFGLGEDARVRKIVVEWPDGTRQEVRAPAVDRLLVIRQE